MIAPWLTLESAEVQDKTEVHTTHQAMAMAAEIVGVAPEVGVREVDHYAWDFDYAPPGHTLHLQ